MLIIKTLDFAGIIFKLGFQNYAHFQVILIFNSLFGYKIK